MVYIYQFKSTIHNLQMEYEKHVIQVDQLCFDFCVLKTPLISDKLLCFGDFQEGVDLNKKIFDQIIYTISDNQYDLSDATIICTGDMYGESYINEKGKRIIIKGKDGIPEYINYKIAPMMYYVIGNHDISSKWTVDENAKNNIHLIDKKIITLCHGTTITGVNGIHSSKNEYPSSYPYFIMETKEVFDNACNILKKTNQKLDVFVSHQAPLIHDKLMNPIPAKYQENKNDVDFKKLITTYKPKIHIFGHIHFNEPFSFHENCLYINSDARIILLVPC